MPSFETLKKADLEIRLDEHLRKSEHTLGKHSKFNPFYTRGSHTSGSPVKRETAAAASTAATHAHADGDKAPPKPRSRRVTKAVDTEHEPT